MIETLTKLIGTIKISNFPLFLMTTLHSSKAFRIKKQELIHDDEVPGDNFPYIVMTSHRIH